VPLKPDPTTALEIAAAGAVAPEACFFVGDTAVDIETALNANMQAVGAAWGFRGREELVAAGAHHVIDRPDELLGVLDQRVA
jgi:phosphoglycolate phosphatase